MRWTIAILWCVGLMSTAAAGKTPTAKELLKAMDQNLQYETRTSTVTMQVVESRRTREYKMKTFGRGEEEAAVEYMAPRRDKGTKMLKKGDNLWIYMPRAERTQKISGHMLRQGMMGSDISYEDMMESSDFEEQYEAKVTGEEELDGRPCWRMEATARDDTVTYPKRVLLVDKEYLLPSRQELYALSGMLLKTWTMSEVEEVEGKQVAMRMEIADQLRTGSKTVLVVEEISFKVKVEEEVFSKRWLSRR